LWAEKDSNLRRAKPDWFTASSDWPLRHLPMEPTGGFEPSTSCLQNSCSTSELRRRTWHTWHTLRVFVVQVQASGVVFSARLFQRRNQLYSTCVGMSRNIVGFPITKDTMDNGRWVEPLMHQEHQGFYCLNHEGHEDHQEHEGFIVLGLNHQDTKSTKILIVLNHRAHRAHGDHRDYCRNGLRSRQYAVIHASHASRITSTGGSAPVQILKAAAPWWTSMERPSWVRQPAALANCSRRVGRGRYTRS
jgi:hypothetical protein